MVEIFCPSGWRPINARIRVIQNVMRTYLAEFEPIMEREISAVHCSINWLLDSEQVSDTGRQQPPQPLNAGGLRKPQTQ